MVRCDEALTQMTRNAPRLTTYGGMVARSPLNKQQQQKADGSYLPAIFTAHSTEVLPYIFTARSTEVLPYTRLLLVSFMS